MRFSNPLYALMLIAQVQAVDMKNYKASSGVDHGFKAFLKAVYSAAEDVSATTSFTDFFPTSGTLIVLSNTATGASEILALKQKLLPPNGNKRWNHFPGATTLFAESSTQVTYDVQGIIDTTFTPGNCSQAVFGTQFTVLKVGGKPEFTLRHHSLQSYNDYSVVPDKAPTDIPCNA